MPDLIIFNFLIKIRRETGGDKETIYEHFGCESIIEKTGGGNSVGSPSTGGRIG
jgi:hypothetical protein